MTDEIAVDGRGDEFRVVIDGVWLGFGRRPVFRNLSCGFLRGKITVVLGGSGVGKSTLLKMMGGLVRPDAGSVWVAGQDVTRLPERRLQTVRDRVGMLFQGGALLDSMSIFDNVALPLREHSQLSEPDIASEVRRRLDAVGLADVEALLPSALSGGMRRRAALARALVRDPELVLVDEPFSGLDPVTLRLIEKLFVSLNESLGLTLVVTSHHLASSLRMAHRLVFLVDGGAVSGAPRDLLQSDDPRVTEFLAAEREDDWEPHEAPPEASAASGGAR